MSSNGTLSQATGLFERILREYSENTENFNLFLRIERRSGRSAVQLQVRNTNAKRSEAVKSSFLDSKFNKSFSVQSTLLAVCHMVDNQFNLLHT